MADGNPVIVAVDGSEHSKKAFECKLYMITRLSFIIKTVVFQNALRKSGSLIINVAYIYVDHENVLPDMKLTFY